MLAIVLSMTSKVTNIDKGSTLGYPWQPQLYVNTFSEIYRLWSTKLNTKQEQYGSQYGYRQTNDKEHEPIMALSAKSNKQLTPAKGRV